MKNTGSTASDEVVQIYGSAPASRVKKSICQLLDFVRVKNIAPGETRHVALEISESVIMKQADQKMYENKKSSR